tara:strand:+ start:324 stop:533 length:210 start_codon:yes stop_codon:yes gene_type:complete
MQKVKAWLDRHVERLISRKFLAWGTATVLVYNNMLTSEDWVAVTLVYIGSQALVDAAIEWRHGSNNYDN